MTPQTESATSIQSYPELPALASRLLASVYKILGLLNMVRFVLAGWRLQLLMMNSSDQRTIPFAEISVEPLQKLHEILSYRGQTDPSIGVITF